jgi:hypothetical protein
MEVSKKMFLKNQVGTELIYFIRTSHKYLTYSISGKNIYGHSTFRPQHSVQSYYTVLERLIDLLSKREFLYRQFMETSFKNFYLPTEMTATPENPLINEVKNNLFYIDPSTYLSENSRNIIYLSLDFIKLTYLKTSLYFINNTFNLIPINLSFFNSYFLYYFTGSNLNKIANNEEFYKDQFRPLRKGITSLLRLHATGAIAMPIEVRLQILASSRDVIHS